MKKALDWGRCLIKVQSSMYCMSIGTTLRELNRPSHGYINTTLLQWTAVKMGAKSGVCCFCNWLETLHCPEETQPSIMNRPATQSSLFYIACFQTSHAFLKFFLQHLYQCAHPAHMLRSNLFHMFHMILYCNLIIDLIQVLDHTFLEKRDLCLKLKLLEGVKLTLKDKVRSPAGARGRSATWGGSGDRHWCHGHLFYLA